MGQPNNGAHDARRQADRDREKMRRDKHKSRRDELEAQRQQRRVAAQRLIDEARKARGE